MAMHLAGVPTAVASCGTAFGAEHVVGDPAADRRRLVRPRRGHLHLRRRRGRPGRRAEGVRRRAELRRADVRRHRPGRAGPVRAAPDPRRHRGARPGGPPRAAVRVRDPRRCCASTTWTPPRAGSPRCSARCRWSPGSSARTCATSTPAGWPAGPAGTTSRWSSAGSGRRRAHPPTAPAPVAGAGARPRRSATTRACTSSARRSRRRCRSRPSPGPAYDELPEQAFSHPAFAAVHRAVQAAGGVCAGRDRRGLAGGGASPRRRPTRSAGWSPSWPSSRWSCRAKTPDEARYVGGVHRRGAAGAGRAADRRDQVAAAAHEPRGPTRTTYHELFGDLVPLEQYRIALREQAAGVAR